MVDQDPVGQPNDKEPVKHQPTLPNIGMLPSQMSNGQSVSASDVSSDGPSQRLELKKSDVVSAFVILQVQVEVAINS